MRVLVPIQNRYVRLPDGSVWTPAQGYYKFWTRYLTVFDGVDIVARVKDVDVLPENHSEVLGEGVDIKPIPHYLGPTQLLKVLPKVVRTARQAVDFKAAIINRAPTIAGTAAMSKIRKNNFPYGIELVTDPDEVLTRKVVKHPLAPLFRWKSRRDLEIDCKHATAVAYVTRESLQKKYPTDGHGFAISDVIIHEENFAKEPRHYDADKKSWTLIYVGTFASLQKAPDNLLKALAMVVKKGHDVKLGMAGQGKFLPDMEKLAAQLGIKDHVTFFGMLNGPEAVRVELYKADIFMLPSRSEGLPRALVEAMATGIPAIGSTVGGIPELLLDEAMVPPEDIPALAAKIETFITQPDLVNRMAESNLKLAREYDASGLQEKQRQFFLRVKEATQEWQERHHIQASK